MNTRHSHAELSTALFDIQTMTVEELEEKYLIEVGEDDSVWDTLEFKEFDNLHLWAVYTDEVNNDGNFGQFDKRNSKHYFDDE